MNRPPPRPLGDALRDALPAYHAPESLRAWARAQAAGEPTTGAPARASRRLRYLGYAASIVIAGVIGAASEHYRAGARRTTEVRGDLVATLVDAHVRSLMAGHLTDVRSSDQHTVKPWFAGKVTFAPAVPELAAQGFPLVGGRVEYVAGRTAAALVYGRRLHTINLFIWPESAPDDVSPVAAYDGYSLVHWTGHRLSYWAVSDAGAPDLQAFERAYRSAP